MSARLAARPNPLPSNLGVLQPRPPNTLLTNPRMLYQDDPNARGTSSVYSVPDAEAVDTALDQKETRVAHEPTQAIRIPPQQARRQPLRIITRRGHVLCSDGVFREKTEPITARQPTQKSSDAFQCNHPRADVIPPPQTITRKPVQGAEKSRPHENAHNGCTIQQTLPDPGVSRDRNAIFKQSPNISKANLPRSTKLCEEVPELRPLHEVTFEDLFDEPVAVPASRFVISDDKFSGRPVRRPSFVRRLSDSVKRRLNSVSKARKDHEAGTGVVRDHVRQAKAGAKVLSAVKTAPTDGVKKAMSRKNTTTSDGRSKLTQQVTGNLHIVSPDRIAGSTANMNRTLPLRGLEIYHPTKEQVPHAHLATPVLAQRCTKVPGIESKPTQPLRIRAANPNRETKWSDFMDPKNADNDLRNNAMAATPLRHEPNQELLDKALPPLPLQIQHKDSRSAGQTWSEVRNNRVHNEALLSPMPPRKELHRKPVDTSCKSWMPPDRTRGAAARGQSVQQQSSSDANHFAGRQYYDMTPDFPNVNDLFDPVEEIIDIYYKSDGRGGEVGGQGKDRNLKPENARDMLDEDDRKNLAGTVSLRPKIGRSQYRRARQEERDN